MSWRIRMTHAKTHTHIKTRAQQRKHETHVNIKNKVTNKTLTRLHKRYTHIFSRYFERIMKIH